MLLLESPVKMSNSTEETIYTIVYTYPETVAQLLSLTLIMASTIFGNFYAILVLYMNNKMRTPQYLFMINLAASDFLSGFLCMPLTWVTALHGRWTLGLGACRFHAFAVSMLFHGTIFTMTAMTIEKYFSLVRPLSRYMTTRKAKQIIVWLWLTCLALTMLPFLGWGRFTYNSTTFSCGVAYPENLSEKLFLVLTLLLGFILPLGVTLFAYVSIFIAVKKHALRISKFTKGHAFSEAITMQKQLIITNVIIVGVFLVCWTPFFILLLLASVNSDVSKLPRGLGVVAYWCGYSASVWNPVIYFTRNQKLREGGKAIIVNIRDYIACKRQSGNAYKQYP